MEIHQSRMSFSVLGMKSEITHDLDPLGTGCYHRRLYA